MRVELTRKPLKEALFEARWGLPTGGVGEAPNDPQYALVVGRFYELLRGEYGVHEPQPASRLPPEMSPYVVHHRFRTAPGGWPVVQVGPGVITVNDTEGYRWDDFRRRSVEAVEKLGLAHPDFSNRRFERLLLRYINTIEFDYDTVPVSQFLRDTMGVSASLPPGVFDGTASTAVGPTGFMFNSAYALPEVSGYGAVKMALGTHEGNKALIFELLIEATGSDLPKGGTDFEAWIDRAHEFIDTSFFTLIKGELLERFK